MGAVDIKIEGGTKWKNILQKLADMKMGVKAGILNNATTTDGQSIAAYAVYNEFGTSRIPPRPFMRTAAKKNQRKWVNAVAYGVKNNSAETKNWEAGLVLAGEDMKADIQNSIQNGSWQPNAPGTVDAKKRKGKVEPDHPLIDTGQMIAAVSYEVVKK